MILEILKNHEAITEDVKHVFYSNADNQNLFISFAGKVSQYVSATWFYKFDNTPYNNLLGNFLFIKNDDGVDGYNTYNEERYSRLIKHYIDKLKVKKLITYGPSMGGVASIIYGMKFNADVIISIDPQPINYDYKELVAQIQSFNPPYSERPPKFYFNYTFVKSRLGTQIPTYTKAFMDALQYKNIILTQQPYNSFTHLDFIPSKEYLIQIMQLLDQIKVERYTKFKTWF